jgi:hypothetical protein
MRLVITLLLYSKLMLKKLCKALTINLKNGLDPSSKLSSGFDYRNWAGELENRLFEFSKENLMPLPLYISIT